MNFTTLTLERYSVRNFKDEPVTEAQIENILEVARNAPTACNKQPQRIYVLFSKDGREKIRRSTECHFNAPVYFAVCYNKNESWKRAFDNQDYGMVDCAIVMTQMMLKIHEMGLGSCFVAWFDPQILKKELDLPPELIPVGILPCGVPADESAPLSMHSDKKPLSDITIFE